MRGGWCRLIHSIELEAFAALDKLTREEGKRVEMEVRDGRSRKRARLNDEKEKEDQEVEKDKTKKRGGALGGGGSVRVCDY